jgi:hypothetical protein
VPHKGRRFLVLAITTSVVWVALCLSVGSQLNRHRSEAASAPAATATVQAAP